MFQIVFLTYHFIQQFIDEITNISQYVFKNNYLEERDFLFSAGNES